MHEDRATLKLSHLSQEERRVYVLADNKVALNSSWDQETLALELQALVDLDFDVSLTGFSTAEIDLPLDAAQDANATSRRDRGDEVPLLAKDAASRLGD